MPQTEVIYPDTIKTDDGRFIRVSTANPSQRIRVHGRNLRVRDIPLTAAQLACTHIVRGIAFRKGDLVSCDKHGIEPLQTEVVEVH